MLPVKWLALECLEKGKYSSKSDVVCMLETQNSGDRHAWANIAHHVQTAPKGAFSPGSALFAIRSTVSHITLYHLIGQVDFSKLNNVDLYGINQLGIG